ncbi:MAG: ATP-dependent zinc metalloprotease FtsH [Clostridiaceae bacterium]
MNNKQQLPASRLTVFSIIMLIAIAVIYMFSGPQKNVVTFDKFLSDMDSGVVTSVKALPDPSGVTILSGVNGNVQEMAVVYNNEFLAKTTLTPALKEKIQMQVPKSGSTFDGIAPIFSMLLTIGLLAFVFNTLMKNNNAGPKSAMNFGKSKARLINPDSKKVTFADVAGATEEKYELMEVVDFLKNPGKYQTLGAKIPKGILMVGHPGTGKTLLARAVAGEAGVPFYIISGSDFVEMFVGVGASRVRDLFEQAKKSAPSIVFLDEIDAVGRQRGTGFGGGHDEREQTLNQLLVEMDGFEENEGIVVMAATNRADVLDPALLRPGRFDRQIYIDVPDSKGREEILKLHVRNKPVGDDVNLSIIAKTTSGFTGAELENLTNEAALLAARNSKKFITMSDFEEARTKVQLGPEKKSRVQTEKTRLLTAYHEAGHAIVARSLPGIDPVTEVSIIPRGAAGGYTMHLPMEDTVYIGKNDLLDQLSVLYGGRCSEKLILNDISTGAKSDIDRASKIARAMVVDYGMSDIIGNLSFGSGDEVFLGRDMGKTKMYSNQMGDLIDKEVKDIVDAAYKRAEDILKDKMDTLHLVARTLLDKESIQAYEFESLYTTGKLPEPLSEIEVREANDKILRDYTERKNKDTIQILNLHTTESQA